MYCSKWEPLGADGSEVSALVIVSAGTERGRAGDRRSHKRKAEEQERWRIFRARAAAVFFSRSHKRKGACRQKKTQK